MKLKLCGIRRDQDIEIMNRAMPDYIGFIFVPASKRYIAPETAAKLSQKLNKGIKKVGVFVNEEPENLLNAANIADLDVIQLHGDENPDYINSLRRGFHGEIWKAVRVKAPADVKYAEGLPADMLLYDSFSAIGYGGTGKRADLKSILAAKPQRPFFLAGGINAGNLREILDSVTPYGIDISGGFEVNGVKDQGRLNEILSILKGRNTNE